MAHTLRRFPFGAVVFLIVAASGSAFAQQVRDRELVSLYSFPMNQTPIEIVSIKLKGEDVQPGKKIKGDDEWLRGLAIRIRNVSDKPISYVEFVLRFPRPGRVVGYSLNYGVNSSNGEPRREYSPPAIQPGETLDLVLTKEKYATFLYVLAQGEVSPDFDTASYYLSIICFENEPDIRWDGGNLRRRDPNNAYKFNLVGPYVLPARQGSGAGTVPLQ